MSISWPIVFPVPKAREHQSISWPALLASFQCPKRGSIMSISWPAVFPVPKAREHHQHQLASPCCMLPVPQAREHHEHQLAGCFSGAQSTGAS